MSDPTIFSIVLPVHNGIAHIKECVNSILNQTYENFNLIILENHSTDGTLEFISSISDKRIKIFTAESFIPMEDNWMRINDIPKNEFFTIIGHDDLYDNNYLEVMNNLILKHPNASLYQTHFRFINFNGEFKRSCLPMAINQFSFEFLACQFKRTLDSMGTGYMMRTKDFEKVGGLSSYKNMIFGDYELWFKLSNISYKATAIEECFSYREHDSISSLTSSFDYQKAMFQYLFFVKKQASKSPKLRLVVDRYAPEYLLYMIRGLLLRGLLSKNNKISIKDLFRDFQIKTKEFLAIENYSFNNDIYIKLYILIGRFSLFRVIFREFVLLKFKIKCIVLRKYFKKI